MSTKKIKKLEVDYLINLIKSQNETIIKQSMQINQLCETLSHYIDADDVDELDFLMFLKEYEKDVDNR